MSLHSPALSVSILENTLESPAGCDILLGVLASPALSESLLEQVLHAPATAEVFLCTSDFARFFS